MVNKVILIGNVGLDPEVRTTEGGVKVARVRLATTERLFDRASNETKEHTEWHTITLWRGLADVVDRFVRKGSQIYIEGRLRTREWMDKDNNKRYTTEILAARTIPLRTALRLPPTAHSRRGLPMASRAVISSRHPVRQRLRSPSRRLLRSRPTIRTTCLFDFRFISGCFRTSLERGEWNVPKYYPSVSREEKMGVNIKYSAI